MVERGGWKPRPKEEKFDSGSQGGKPSEGDNHLQAPRMPDEKPRLFTEEEARREIRREGLNLIESINEIDPESLSEEDFAKTRYYRHNIAISFLGVDPRDTSNFPPAFRDTYNNVVTIGAVLAAYEYLLNDPNDVEASKAAVDISHEGINATLQAHRDFSSVVHSSVIRFLQKHQP